VEEKINVNRGITKKCQVAILEGLDSNREKEICKAH
jgi:hypothetical protein